MICTNLPKAGWQGFRIDYFEIVKLLPSTGSKVCSSFAKATEDFTFDGLWDFWSARRRRNFGPSKDAGPVVLCGWKGLVRFRLGESVKGVKG